MEKHKRIELLAPAKDKETAISAIDCGADAVYIGGYAFGARKNAPNSLEDIKEVVDYAHKFWAKVHVTINTILSDNELIEAVNFINELSKIGVDAIIIQDLGILEELIKNLPPKCPLIHISTQCDNYLPEKISFFNSIGVKRVILARELSIEQIKKIHKENPNLELECFIHGALCVSMSGQCYLSQYIGGRSANRGECAQPCRKKYDVIDDKGNVIAKDIYPLCLKDFNGSEAINDLIDAGICSFKIEGRLKDTSYVKNIVSYYRKLIDNKISSGKSNYQFESNPEKTFNRGFTDYFLYKRKDCYNFESPKSKGEYLGKVISVKQNCFIIKTKKEINRQDGLYFNDDGCLVNNFVVDKNGIIIYPNKKVNLKNGDDVFRNFDTKFEKEIKKPVKRQIGVLVEVDENNKLTLTDENEVSVTVDLIGKEKANNPEKMKESFVKQFSKTGEGDFYIADIKIAPNSELPFMPISDINRLRRDTFEYLMQKRVQTYEKNKEYQGMLKYAKYYKKEVDFRANVHNNSAKRFYEKCGVKVLEPSFETQKPNRQVELMHSKHCIKYALNMCKSPKNLFLRDSHSKIYPLKFNCKDCEMSVLSVI